MADLHRLGKAFWPGPFIRTLDTLGFWTLVISLKSPSATLLAILLKIISSNSFEFFFIGNYFEIFFCNFIRISSKISPAIPWGLSFGKSLGNLEFPQHMFCEFLPETLWNFILKILSESFAVSFLELILAAFQLLLWLFLWQFLKQFLPQLHWKFLWEVLRQLS